jgi:tRNA G10  N-methylase Trm11
MKQDDTLCILGRQPAIGRAELEALYGPENLLPTGEQAVVINKLLSPSALRRLGGTVKMARVVTVLDTNAWPKVASYLRSDLAFAVNFSGEGKLQVGISSYGFAITPQKLMATGLEVKKALKKATDRSVRLVSSKDALHLSTPQVIHNDLDRSGYEIIALRTGSKTIIARTIAEQDIAAYTKRDQLRPKRDARVGMLPPKLAQTLINLASSTMSDDVDIQHGSVLDPFCGTGVVLQEALLMGHKATGSDLDPRMISYTKENLEWLADAFSIDTSDTPLVIGDATTTTWSTPFDFVASETYLGQPLSQLPPAEKLNTIVHTCNQILTKFLRNIGSQIPSGTRLCLAVPAWKRPDGSFKHLSLLDQLEQLGYNRVSFEHSRDEELLYFREDQIVARQLLVITRK